MNSVSNISYICSYGPGVSATGTIESKDCCTKETCCPATESTITEATTDTEYELEHVDTLSQWETVFTSSKRSTLIVKFTVSSFSSKLSAEFHFCGLHKDNLIHFLCVHRQTGASPVKKFNHAILNLPLHIANASLLPWM